MNRYFYILPLALATLFPAKMSAQSVSPHTEIPPLLKSNWGQQAPFYYMTPVIDSEHAKTGCVATALSQVIYFYRFPEKGKEGVFTNTGSTGDFSFDFANNTFDYELMKDSYETSTPDTDPSALEASKLILAAGVTVNMNYGVSSSSGTFSMIPAALSEWFLYPEDGMGQLSKDCFTTEEWEKVIYDELAAGRPVLYLGGNGTSSHVFVCDGYKEGKFHMNWGWYGEKNGYFNLSNLQTERVGDGSILSLNSGQRIIRGIRLKEDKTPEPLATASSFGYNAQKAAFTIEKISCFSNNTVITPGLRIIDKKGAVVKEIWSSANEVLGRKNSDIEFSVDLSGIDNGSYVIRPVYLLAESDSQNSQIYDVYCNIHNSRYLDAEISDHKITACTGKTDIQVSVDITDYYQYSSFIKSETYNSGFSVFAENTGNANITRMGVKLCSPGSGEELFSISYPESLAPGEARTVSLGIPSIATPGEYDLIIFDGTSKKDLADPIRIILHDGSKILTLEGSPFRFMPLSDEKGTATILYSKPASPAETSFEMVIDPEVKLNGKDYKITEIGPRLLYGRTDISKLVISENVEKIDPNAFSGCTNLSEIIIKASNPPVIHPSAFDASTIANAILNVPEGSVDLYRESPVWSGFKYAEEDEDDTPGNLIMPNFSIKPGDYFDATLNFDTENLYYGCQFNITMPQGLTIASDGVSVPKSLQDNGFTVGKSELKDDNSYTIVIYSSNNSPFPVGNTEILDINFISDVNFKGGTISLFDIIFSEAGDDRKFYDVAFKDTTCVVTADVETSVDVVVPANMPANVYSVTGVKVCSNVCLYEAMPLLTPGLYIVEIQGKSYKILKR